jgi:class 3 adenylate cyclase
VRAALAALLEAYLGRRSAARVQGGALRRGTGETIRAVLLSADLRDFTGLSEATEPAAMIAVFDAWFDRVAGAVHAFGGEVLKFIGDGVLAIFPVTGAIGSAVNLVSRLEGLCRPLGRSVLISGALAAETTASLMPLGEHLLRGIAAPCAVFTRRMRERLVAETATVAFSVLIIMNF